MTNYSIHTSVKNYLRENTGMFTLYIIMAIAFPVVEVLLPRYYGMIVEGINKIGKGQSILQDSNVKHGIIMVIIFWVVLQALIIIHNWLETQIVPQLQSHVRKDVILSILETFKNNYRDLEIGDIVSKIVKLPIFIRDLAHQFIGIVIPLILVILVVIGYFFYIDKTLGLIYIANLFVSICVISSVIFSCMDHAKKLDIANNNLHETIGDVLNNLKNVYSADSSILEMNNIKQQQDNMDKEFKKTMACSARVSAIFSTLNFIMCITIIGYAFWQYARPGGNFSVSQIIGVFIITIHLVGSNSKLSGELNDILYNIGNVKAVQTYFDQLETLAGVYSRKTKTVPIKLRSGEIQLKNVTMKFLGKPTLFSDLNLHIKSGEKILLLGHNGSGKSSLMKLLMKMNYYQSGDILIDGTNIKHIDANKLRKQLIYVDQHPLLFNRSVYENIIYGIDDISREQVIKMLQELDLGNIISMLDLPAGKNGSNLSGGQRQVIYLVRCLLKADSSQIVLLDEPTSALDYRIKKQVFNMLERLMKDKTVIMITHDPFLHKFADREITLSNGEIVSDKARQPAKKSSPAKQSREVRPSQTKAGRLSSILSNWLDQNHSKSNSLSPK